VTTTAR